MRPEKKINHGIHGPHGKEKISRGDAERAEKRMMEGGRSALSPSKGPGRLVFVISV
jgi:hypothetical protein